MQAIRDEEFFRRYSMCVALVAISLIVAPLLALAPTALPFRWPTTLGNLLFFWPQHALLLGGVRTELGVEPLGARWVAGAVVFWLVMLASYVLLTRRWSMRSVLLMLGPLVVASALLATILLSLAGYSLVLDGP